MLKFKLFAEKANKLIGKGKKKVDENKGKSELESIVSKPSDKANASPSLEKGNNDELKLPKKQNKYVKAAITAGISLSIFSAGAAFSYFSKIDYVSIFRKKAPAIEQRLEPAYEPAPYERVSFSENEDSILSSGKIPILMYHKIGAPEDRFTVSPNTFRNQMQKLYENNFQLISLEDYVNNDFSSLKPGKKAAVITFDDADQGQFEYAKFNNNLIYDEFGNRVIDPNSAVGIMANFYSQHPDFDKKAAFFVDFADANHNYQAPFLEEKEVKQKLEYLIKEGFEIGYHTFTHASTAKISLNRMKDEVERSRIAFKHYLGDDSGQIKNYFAFPFGQKPGDQAVLDYINKEFAATFNAWGGAADAYASRKENSPPRIEISNNLERDVTSRRDVLQKSSYWGR